MEELNVKTSKLFRQAGLLALIAVMTGCTMKFGVAFPNDRFAYPNSNIEPLGKVHAEVSKWSAFTPVIADKEMYESLRGQAAQQKGGDMIVNGKFQTEILMIPLMYINFFRTTVTLDGTAAKQTIGRQELH